MERDETSERLSELRGEVRALGLTLEPSHHGTPGQLAFALPVRGLDHWGAVLKRDWHRVAMEVRNTREGAVEAVLAAHRRAPQPMD